MMAHLWRDAMELTDDDRMPMTVAQAEAEELYVREKMAVACEIARVVGHEMGPAEWDTWLDDDPALCATCVRCTATVSAGWDGDEWIMRVWACLMPCAGPKEAL